MTSNLPLNWTDVRHGEGRDKKTLTYPFNRSSASRRLVRVFLRGGCPGSADGRGHLGARGASVLVAVGRSGRGSARGRGRRRVEGPGRTAGRDCGNGGG